MAQHYPFSAIVGADEMALALILTTISPQVGGVLVRGEKGTAKSTMVRALADLLPPHPVVAGCRFGCDPATPDPSCPDGPHAPGAATEHRPARLVELPVGASEDRVTGSLDLGRALGAGEAAFEPGLLAQANRGILYVDEVNLLHDHLVDLLLDAAAMGRNTVEREGISVSHAARMVLIGTMNPEEGELRPQLLDRFGLTVEVGASREPATRAEVVRRRLAFDADPDAFIARFTAEQQHLQDLLVAAQSRLPEVTLSDWAVERIAMVCAGFDVDGMRADIVTARAAQAHAAWMGRDTVTREDIRAAARLALPHRRRRQPFDAPGLDEDLLDQLLGDEEPPTPPPPAEPPPSGPPTDSGSNDDGGSPPPPVPDGADTNPALHAEQPAQQTASAESAADASFSGAAPTAIAQVGATYRVRRLAVRGMGRGSAGRRSRAITDSGRVISATRVGSGRIHLGATVRAAARRQTPGSRLRITADDVRRAITQGQESNLVLLVVDASGSMGARQRMQEVKAAVLSLLTDAYQRRDRVGVISFRAQDAQVVLPPTSSVEAAAACLTDLPHGGRTPLAQGLRLAARTLQLEHIRDPRQRPLLVLVTDGRATGADDALQQARKVADQWPGTGVDAVVVDCETGRFRMGLAAELAERMGAEYLALGQVAAEQLVGAVQGHRSRRLARQVA